MDSVGTEGETVYQARTLAYQAVRYYRKWARRFKSDIVRYEGLTLPAKHLRLCGAEFHDNRYFLTSARYEADRLIKNFGLSKESRVLDVGCGMGRLAIGILSAVGEIKAYHGMDVQSDCVEWCSSHITKEHANCRFTWVNAKNDRYNPQGESLVDASRLPFDDASFDIIYLFSVFTHLTLDHIRIYLREFHRIAQPKGRVFVTAYVEENVPDETVNPKNYRAPCAGPLHFVRYEKGFFERVLAETGWKVDTFNYAQEHPGQSAYYLSKA